MTIRNVVNISVVMLLLFSAVFAGNEEERLSLPLVGQYALYRSDINDPREHGRGEYRLIELDTPSSGIGMSFGDVVFELEEVAVVDKIIVGRSGKSKYFILDGTQKSNGLQYYYSYDQFCTSWSSKTNMPLPQLRKCEQFASSVPMTAAKSLNYQIMKGRGGYSDNAWAFIFQIGTLVIAFLVGLIIDRNMLIQICVGVGLIGNLIANVLISGGGPSAFVGFLVIPLLCCIVGFIGMKISSMFRTIKPRRN